MAQNNLEPLKYEKWKYHKDFNEHPLKNTILKNVKRGPVLDIGCGNGNLLYILKEDFDVEGFDPSEIAVSYAKKRKIKVKKSTIKEFNSKKKYKTILLIDVLAHLHNPDEDFERIMGWLDKNGDIILTIPNRTSLKGFLGKKENNKYTMYFPSFVEFRKFLEEKNLKIKKCFGAGRLKYLPAQSSVIFYILTRKK